MARPDDAPRGFWVLLGRLAFLLAMLVPLALLIAAQMLGQWLDTNAGRACDRLSAWAEDD